jgi:hypothetical protein
MKNRWFRKETPKKRILRLREQYTTIAEKYDIYIRQCPPSFLTFARIIGSNKATKIAISGATRT